MSQWSLAYTKQKFIFQSEFEEFFGYIRNEYTSFNELIGGFEKDKNLYIEFSHKLAIKKERLYTSMAYDKWELNEEDQKNLENFKDNKEVALEKMLFKVKKRLNIGNQAFKPIQVKLRLRLDYDSKGTR